MGKQASSRSPRPPPLQDGHVNGKMSFGMKNCQNRCSDHPLGNNPLLERRGLEGDYLWNKAVLLHSLKNDSMQFGVSKGRYSVKRKLWFCRHVRSIVFIFVLMGSLFLLDSLMFSIVHSMHLHNGSTQRNLRGSQVFLKDKSRDYVNQERKPIVMYHRLLNFASSALAEKEFKPESSKLWKEPYKQAFEWKSCADKSDPTNQGKPNISTGFIMVSANGGLNQQRVAVCNAVAVASLLNATLVLPKFLYSNVWKDPSQFGDIYQEDYFMNLLKDDVNIVKELPSHLQSLDIEAIGSLITDADIVKEAKPTDFVKVTLPLLLQNGVVHFLGFGNRLGFDPLPFNLQRLRCKCNFHALKFVPKIQQVGSLLVSRIRKHKFIPGLLDKQLLGNFTNDVPFKGHDASRGPSKYLALHLRFEIDMVAYSQCEFGGGENERKELQTYREIHFPIVVESLKNAKYVSPAELRKLGRCPLTPEEAALVLSGLGFKRGTYIYLAGSHIYGGQSRMHPFTSLYHNLVTKEDLLTPDELAPFRNFSSQVLDSLQLAALDFIACATADVFAMTDSGSQLSSLVTGYRVYYGGGHAPTLRPNKKRLAGILAENGNIGWNGFADRVSKMIDEGQRVRVRGVGRSIYRQPRCPECMCKRH